jgi:predicted nucleic acid-binding protein
VVDPDLLPDESAIAAVTLAELAAGPHAATEETERSRRQDRLQWAAATWDALSFDVEAARAYGRVFAATRRAGRSARARPADKIPQRQVHGSGIGPAAGQAGGWTQRESAPIHRR